MKLKDKAAVTGEMPRKNIFKALGLGLSAYIARLSLIALLSTFMTNMLAVTIIANIAVIILGGAYYKLCMKPFGIRIGLLDEPILNRRILASILAIACFGIILLQWFLHDAIWTNNSFILESLETLRMQNGQENQVLYLAYAVLIAPIAEEILFRGFFFRCLYEANKQTAYYTSVLFFAVVHGNIVQIIVAALGGVLYAMIYAKTKSLRFCIAAHMLYNFLAVVLSIIVTATGYNKFNTMVLVTFLLLILLSFVMVHRTSVSIQEQQP